MAAPRHVELLGCTVDLGAHLARWPDGERQLTATEGRLLAYLVAAEGRAVPQRELLEQVWGYRGGVVTRTVKTTVGRLRAKVERDPAEPDHVLAVAGVGYRFAPASREDVDAAREDVDTWGDEPAPLIPDRAPLRAIPPATALCGRVDDAAKLREWLGSASLVTVTGPAGVGKTALALTAAAALRPGGEARFVDLSNATTREDVLRAVASALGTALGQGDAGSLARALGGAIAARSPGLLLDGAEAAAPPLAVLLGDWMVAAPQARFLVTSREPLRVGEERALPLRPLDRRGSAELFARRLSASALPGYADPAQLLPVIDRLDGLPLAIEMAAAWADVLPPGELLRRLDSQLDLLGGDRVDRPARHATLRAAIASSWASIEPWERTVLGQLAAFGGPFSLPDVDAVLRPPKESPAAPIALQRLCLRSLVQVVPGEGDAPARFRLYRAVRALAREHAADGEADARHGVWFARHGDEAALDRLERQGGASRIDALRAARDELHAAASAAVRRGDVAVAVPCTRALDLLARFEGPALGHADLLADVLALPLGERERGALLEDRGRLRAAGGEGEAAREDLAAARALPDPERKASAGEALAALLLDTDPQAAEAAARQALADAIAADAPDLEGRARRALARALHLLGRGGDAEVELEKALVLARSDGDRRLLAFVQKELGALHLERGRPLRALSLYEHALGTAREVGDRASEAQLLHALGALLASHGDTDSARTRLEDALHLARQLGSRSLEGGILATRAAVDIEHSSLDDARRALDLALRIAREASDRRLHAEATGALGELHLALGHVARGRPLLEDAIADSRRLGLPGLEGRFLGALGALRADAGDLNPAREAFGRGERLLDGARLRADRVRLLERWAEAEAAHGDEARATSLLERAAAAAELSVADGPVRG